MPNFRNEKPNGGQRRPDTRALRAAQTDMLHAFVAEDGTLQLEKSQGFLNLIGDNIPYIPNLSGNNVSLVASQKPGIHWPIFSGASKKLGLTLVKGASANAAAILVPRDAEGAKEAANLGAKQDESTREAIRESADHLDLIAGDLRDASIEARDEQGRIGNKIREIAVAKAPDMAARLSECKTRFAEIGQAIASNTESAELLTSEAVRLRDDAANNNLKPLDLAQSADEAAAALTRIGVENEVNESAHASLARASRYGRNENKKCVGVPKFFDPVRCVYDLEKDFVHDEVWEQQMALRRGEGTDAGESATAVAASLRSRELPAPEGNQSAGDLTKFVFALVKSMAAESGASRSSTIFATYFTAKALGASNIKCPATKIEPGADGKVNRKEILGSLTGAIDLSRLVLANVYEKRGELQSQVAAQSEAVAVGGDNEAASVAAGGSEVAPETVVEEAEPEVGATVHAAGGRGR